MKKKKLNHSQELKRQNQLQTQQKTLKMKGISWIRKLFRLMKKIDSCFNPQATRSVEDNNYEREIILDQVNLALFSADFIKEPTTYEEALNYERKSPN
jgi:hypothetical protein